MGVLAPWGCQWGVNRCVFRLVCGCTVFSFWKAAWHGHRRYRIGPMVRLVVACYRCLSLHVFVSVNGPLVYVSSVSFWRFESCDYNFCQLCGNWVIHHLSLFTCRREHWSVPLEDVYNPWGVVCELSFVIYAESRIGFRLYSWSLRSWTGVHQRGCVFRRVLLLVVVGWSWWLFAWVWQLFVLWLVGMVLRLIRSPLVMWVCIVGSAISHLYCCIRVVSCLGLKTTLVVLLCLRLRII